MRKGPSYRFGSFLLDPAKRLLERDSAHVPLAGKAFDTLLTLVANNERLVGKDELLKTVWPDSIVEENNLSQSISAVRKALGDTAHDHRYIETVPGRGYRFMAPVTFSPKEDLPPLSPVPVLAPPPEGRQGRVSFSHPVWRIASAVSLIGIVVLVVFSIRPTSTNSRVAGQPNQAAPPSPRPAIAILGFDNLSGRTDDAWISTALSEMLRTELSPGGNLRLVSGEEVERAKTEFGVKQTSTLARDTLNKLRANLAPDLLILGSYAVVGSPSRKQIRLDLRIENPISGEVEFELAEVGLMDDLFDMVSRVGARLRQDLGTQELSPTEIVVARASFPSNSDAAQLYSEALTRLRLYDAVGARDRLLTVIKLDPKFPLAHEALAHAWSDMGYTSKAQSEALIALRLSSSLSREERLPIEGRYRIETHDWNNAVEIYRTLFGLFPDDLDYGIKLAVAQSLAAKPRDALATTEKLRRFAPPMGSDPRIELETARAWNVVGDLKQMQVALAAAASKAEARGARLLLARARNQQCYAFRFTGDQKRALAACRLAEQIYHAAGDHGGEANTLRLFGDVTSDFDVPQAMRLYNRCLAMEREIGNRSGEASVLNELAIQYSRRGEHAMSAKFFDHALRVARELDNRVTAIGTLINVGYEVANQGKLEQARRIYRQAEDEARDLGNLEIQALALCDLGLLDQAGGDLDSAENELQKARELFKTLHNNTQITEAINGLGEIAMSRADFNRAQQYFDEAQALQQSAQQAIPTAQTQLHLAGLSLEKDDSPEKVEHSARQVITVFRQNADVSGEATATELLARALLAQGKSFEALRAADDAVSIARKAEPNIHLSLAITAASIRATLRPNHAAQSIRALETIAIQAHRTGYAGVELGARLAEAQLRTSQDATSEAQDELHTVSRDATKRGYILLARKAGS